MAKRGISIALAVVSPIGGGFLKSALRHSLITLVIVALLAVPTSIFAELGGDVASIQADQSRMKGALRIQIAQKYTVHEIQDSRGITVREFISPAGHVFAVVWRGPSIPDLKALLGAYFDQYSQAAQRHVRRPGRAPLNIQENGLVVQTAGHMHAVSGRAYLADRLPDGVSPTDVR